VAIGARSFDNHKRGWTEKVATRMAKMWKNEEIAAT
jgi:hypothetical protein